MSWTAGARFKYSTTGIHGSYTLVEDLVSIEPNEMQAGDIPSTSLGEPEQILYSKSGWIDPGQSTFRFSLTATKFTALYTLFRQRTEFWALIVLPPEYASGVSMGSMHFKCRISSFKPAQSMEREQNENVMADVRLKVTRLGTASAGGGASGYFDIGTGTV